MHIVVIGGGTGSFTVLRGLRSKVEKITAIVSMFDSGGSTGILRDEMGILPPGDARRCLIALAEEGDILRALFMHRFPVKGSLNGHSFGNLFLAALSSITGSDAEAIKQAAKILRIKGEVMPVTLTNATLCAHLEDGRIIKGESNISAPKHDVSLRIKEVFLEPQAHANPEALTAISHADLIVVGPGDLYTSILPNFLVGGISQAFKQASAKKVYVCNLMTKPGETTGYTASDHIKEILHYAGQIHTVICNTSKENSSLLQKYAQHNQRPVVVDTQRLKELGVDVLAADVRSDQDLVRHDSEKLSRLLLTLM